MRGNGVVGSCPEEHNVKQCSWRRDMDLWQRWPITKRLKNVNVVVLYTLSRRTRDNLEQLTEKLEKFFHNLDHFLLYSTLLKFNKKNELPAALTNNYIFQAGAVFVSRLLSFPWSKITLVVFHVFWILIKSAFERLTGGLKGINLIPNISVRQD